MQLSKYSDFDLFPMYCTQKCWFNKLSQI
jgi:hypothetical protein